MKVLLLLVTAALSVGAGATAGHPVPGEMPPQAGALVPQGPGSLSGVWSMTGYMGSANHGVHDRVARDVNGKIPPLLPAAAAVLQKRLADADQGRIFANTDTECLPQGVPYMIFGAVAGPVQLLENSDQKQVTIISEEQNEIWFIHMGRKHPPMDDIAPTYHGDSIGNWDGDTLIVDTVGLNTKTTLDQVGMPHSDALHVITRIRRIAPDRLEFLVTVDDPKTFSAPWTRRVIYRQAKSGEEVQEYVCDNNRNSPDQQGFQSFK